MMLGVEGYRFLTKEVVDSALRNEGIWLMDYRLVRMLTLEVTNREERSTKRTAYAAIYYIEKILEGKYSDYLKLIAYIRDILSTRSDPKYIAQDVIENTYLQKLETLDKPSGSRATLKFGADYVYLTPENALKTGV